MLLTRATSGATSPSWHQLGQEVPLEQTFEEFLQKELQLLQARVVLRYSQQTQRVEASPAAARHQQEAANLPDPMDEEIAELNEKVPEAAANMVASEATTEEVVERWASLTRALCDDVDSDEKEVVVNRSHSLPVYKHHLQLREAWKLSYHAALRLGKRRRTNSTTQGTRRPTDAVEPEEDESRLQRFVFGPESHLQLIWATFSALFIVWDLVTLPLLFFDLGEFARHLEYIALVTLAFWLADMPMHMFFAVATTAGMVETRPWVLAKRYAKTWLVLDIFIAFVDTFVLTLHFIMEADPNPLMRSTRFFRLLRFVRLVRLLRIVKLEKQAKFILGKLLSTNSLLWVKVSGYFAVMMAINHVIACCWYGVGYYTSDQGNWMQRSNIDSESFPESYVASLHWSMTQFTSATNPIAPNNGWERLFAIIVILMAVASFSSFVGSIGSTISSMRAARRGKILERSKLELFFTERQLPLSLFSKVKAAVRDDDGEMMRLREEEVALIQGVPERFRVEIHKEIFMNSLLLTNIWPRWTHSEAPDFLSSVCHRVMQEHWDRCGQDTFLPRTKCQMVYLLQSGDAEYVDEDRKIKFISVRGDPDLEVLSLPNLWAEWVHTGRLTATSGMCHYAGIDCKQFCTLATHFGGRLCEYLKVLGILLIGEIEALEARNIRVTDLCVPRKVAIEELARRAEQYANLKAKANHHVALRNSTAVRLSKFWQG